MNGEAIKELAARLKAPLELGGFLFRPNDWAVEDPAALVKPGPTAKTLGVTTLGAVKDYVTENRDQLDVPHLAVHVASPTAVHVLGSLMAHARVRECYLSATCADLTDGFLGKFMVLEEFLVGLQVRFVDADDRPRLLALLSNVKHETVKTALDDGMTQVVQARAGVALVSDVAVPNPVTLSPYRTFREVAQPTSLFVLRVQPGRSGGLPEVGLFEADGGAWKLIAIQRVRDFLLAGLEGVAILS